MQILQNIEDIVHHALPVKKLKDAFSDQTTAKNLILNRITFCQSRVNVSTRWFMSCYYCYIHDCIVCQCWWLDGLFFNFLQLLRMAPRCFVGVCLISLLTVAWCPDVSSECASESWCATVSNLLISKLSKVLTLLKLCD